MSDYTSKTTDMNDTREGAGSLPAPPWLGRNPEYEALCTEQDRVWDIAEEVSGNAGDALVSLTKVPRPMSVDEWNLVRHGGNPVDKEQAAEYRVRRAELVAAKLVEETKPGSGIYQPTRDGYAAVAQWLVDASFRLESLEY